MMAVQCPTSLSQLAYYNSLFRGSGGQPSPVVTNSIPAASPNDLPSLIRTVNVMRDVLRQLTSSLTVNNVYNPRPPFFKAEGDKFYSQYPAWNQKGQDTQQGFVYHKEKGGSLDKKQRAHVLRQDRITFENSMQEDPEFVWSYHKSLDSLGVEPLFPTASATGD
jgi:hypothetical protein